MYNLSKLLSKIQSPLLHLEYGVKNSTQFVELIREFNYCDSDCFVSFDVVSLFTSISVEDIVPLIFDLLQHDKSLCNRTKLNVTDVMEAVRRAKSTVFSFKNVLYRQVFDLPMGSCISPVIANIFMEHVVRIALSTFHSRSSL